MKEKRKKELLEAYKNRIPQMGVISYYCKETGDTFLGISKDTRASFNSINMRLSANFHPNKYLLELWNKYGLEGFELSVIKILKQVNPEEDPIDELEKLRQDCFISNPNAKKIWK